MGSSSSGSGGSGSSGSSGIEDGSTTLSESQWLRFTSSSTVWRRRGASSLAWGDSVCNAIISHYGQDVSGNYSLHYTIL